MEQKARQSNLSQKFKDYHVNNINNISPPKYQKQNQIPKNIYINPYSVMRNKIKTNSDIIGFEQIAIQRPQNNGQQNVGVKKNFALQTQYNYSQKFEQTKGQDRTETLNNNFVYDSQENSSFLMRNLRSRELLTNSSSIKKSRVDFQDRKSYDIYRKTYENQKNISQSNKKNLQSDVIKAVFIQQKQKINSQLQQKNIKKDNTISNIFSQDANQNSHRNQIGLCQFPSIQDQTQLQGIIIFSKQKLSKEHDNQEKMDIEQQQSQISNHMMISQNQSNQFDEISENTSQILQSPLKSTQYSTGSKIQSSQINQNYNSSNLKQLTNPPSSQRSNLLNDKYYKSKQQQNKIIIKKQNNVKDLQKKLKLSQIEQDICPQIGFNPVKSKSYHLDANNDKEFNSEGEINVSIDEDDKMQETQNSHKPMLLKSIFENRPPTLFFPYPPQAQKQRPTERCIAISDKKIKKFDLKYSVFAENPYKSVTSAFIYAGFEETDEKDEWNGAWGMNETNCDFRKMNQFQKFNHFPGCWNLGRKDLMYIKLQNTRRKFNDDYNFYPKTYLLSSEEERFQNILEQSDKQLFILKPFNQCCGRGVKVINKKSKLPPKDQRKNYLAQEYIMKPHLINELKYDLRIYVLVTSYNPLRMYIYNEGLVRFATEKYDIKSKSKSRFMHLTNYSVNKKSEAYVKNNKNSEQPSKWSLQELKQKYAELGIDWNQIHDKIKDVLIKVCISVEPSMMMNTSNRQSCFELYGFDIILDQNLKVHLLECNVCPSLASGSAIDKRIKYALISDTLHLVGFKPYDKKKQDKQAQMNKKKIFQKNIKEIIDVNYENCDEKLSPDDWELIIESEEELYRRGNFERIFPPAPEKIDYYKQFFELQRYNNIVLWNSIKSEKGFQQKVTKQIYFNNS